MIVVDKRPINKYTGHMPCLLHANGMEKYHMLPILVSAEHIPRNYIAIHYNTTSQEAMEMV